MAHINLDNNLPGISGLLTQFPETARPLMALADTLLSSPHSLTSGERELIAAYVSHRNNCNFCHFSHSAIAAAHLNDGFRTMDQILDNIDTADISDKMKALLRIAGQVQQSGKAVTEKHISDAREAGASDDEIHITVLIAAAFCMYNRYVDGLGTWSPAEREAFVENAKRRAQIGYK